MNPLLIAVIAIGVLLFLVLVASLIIILGKHDDELEKMGVRRS